MKSLMRVYWLSSFGVLAACGGNVDPALTALESSTGSLNASPDSPTVSLRKAKCDVDGSIFPVATMNYGAAGEQGFQLACDDPNKPNGLAALVESMGTTWAGYNAMAPENCDTLNQQLSYRSNPPLTCTTGATRLLFSYHDTSDNQIKYGAFLGEQPGRSIVRMLGCTELVEALGFDVLDAKPLDPFIYDLFIDMGDDYDLSCKGGTPIVPRRRGTCEATNPADSEFFQNGTAAVNPQTGGFEQGWDVTTASWGPPTNACEWRCSPGFVRQGDQCVVCRDGEIRISKSVCGPNGRYEEVCGHGDWMLTNTCRSADGDLDPNFNPSFSNAHQVNDVLVQGDGKFVVSGTFFAFNGDQTRKWMVRLNSDGTIDPSFNYRANSSPWKAVRLTDGKYLVGGTHGLSHPVRLNQDGSVDTTYQGRAGEYGPPMRDYAIQPDGKAVFTNVAGMIARLNADGSFDQSFEPITDGEGVTDLAVQADGRVLAGGSFIRFGGVEKKGLVRLNPNGSIDLSFAAKFELRYSYPHIHPVIKSIVVQSNQKILVGGTFSHVNGVPIKNIARLNPDGSIDTDFLIGSGLGTGILGDVKSIAVGGGMIAIGGYFYKVNGIQQQNIARLYLDGTVDTSFSTLKNPVNFMNDIGIQSDGRVVAAGMGFYDRGLVRFGPQ